jgi:N-acetylglucosamine kinase-like BadF-type ATPase
LIGIDGGGSGTRAAIGHGGDAVLGVGHAGVSRWGDVGEEEAAVQVLDAVEDAWRAAGEAPRAADSIFLGLAGVATAADHEVAQRLARRIEHRRRARIAVGSDLRIAHAGALADVAPPRRGVVLVAGTGAACIGVDGTGAAACCGGWGPHLGDDGGGHFLGLQAMRAVIRSGDGRGPTTELCARVLAALEIEAPRGMLRLVGPDGDRRRVAALAPLVIELAANRDVLAAEILGRAVGELAGLVAHAVARVQAADGEDEVPWAVVGGLAEAGAPLLNPLREEVRRRCPSARWAVPARTPVGGALLLASETNRGSDRDATGR